MGIDSALPDRRATAVRPPALLHRTRSCSMAVSWSRCVSRRKMICSRLSSPTVRNYVSAIYFKDGVDNRMQ